MTLIKSSAESKQLDKKQEINQRQEAGLFWGILFGGNRQQEVRVGLY